MSDRVSYVCASCGEARNTSQANWRRKKTDMCPSCAVAATHTHHGFVGHPLYNVWKGMFRRLRDDKNYRGLTVCRAWHDPLTFCTWALANGWKAGLTIERVKNTRGYSPKNCRFATRLEQSRNRRVNKITPALAREIKARVRAGNTGYRVAKEMSVETGIGLNTIAAVAYGISWSDIT